MKRNTVFYDENRQIFFHIYGTRCVTKDTRNLQNAVETVSSRSMFEDINYEKLNNFIHKWTWKGPRII